MKDAKQELEQKFMKLPTLNHVGMALMQYTESLFSKPKIRKDDFGVFCIGRICFSFPKGDERICIILVGVNEQTIKTKSHLILARGISSRMLLKDNEAGYACFVIDDAEMLGQAAIFIGTAHSQYMSGRQIPPERADVN